MYRLRLFYVARVFLRALGRRGDGAAVRLYRKAHAPTGG
jgi:RNA 3'-terminal phosphate cyclase